MKITYTAPNRAHHYPYAESLNRLGHLHSFISGFSRFSPRSPLVSVGDKLKRHDFFQNLYLASNKLHAPFLITSKLNRLSNRCLDRSSYPWARQSDVFIHYRTQGFSTSSRLHKEGSQTICIMEEVNSHVDNCYNLMNIEYKRLKLRKEIEKFPDHKLRLKAYEEADFILCPSEFVRRSFIEKGFSAGKLIKVNFGFPSITIQKKVDDHSADDTFRILYVGQLHYRKGLYYAIEAFKKLKYNKKEFIIVGPKTPVTGLENITIPDNVIFTGSLKGEALEREYRRASVFILPSVEEGLALVQGEALAFGVPLLITTNTGGDDLISDGIEGFIVPPGDVDKLVIRLQQMVEDKDLRARMSVAALQAARSLGDWDMAASRLITELTTIINSRRK